METALARIMGEITKDKEAMVFDWTKAALLIKERQPDLVRAGLRDDWENTGGTIYLNGKIVDNEYTFLASTWAVPELYFDGELIECYEMQNEVPNWGPETKWPKSARKILKKKSEEN